MHPTRRQVRHAAAAISATMGVLYYVIGLGVAFPDVNPELSGGLAFFGFSAGSMFMLGAILLALTDRRLLWITGSILQVLVFLGYLSVAPSREPPFEVWGITLRVLQVPLFLMLVYLAWRGHVATHRGVA